MGGAEIERAAEDGIVRGLRERAPEACAALYDRFAERVLRFAAARLNGDGQLAEEIVVDTMLGAARDIGRFNARRSTLAAWVYGIARMRIRAQVRRQGRLKRTPAGAQVPLAAAAGMSDGSDMAAEAAARLDARRQMGALSQALSGIEMEVLVLQCIDQLSLREIGQAVGRSERAVHSLLTRARQKARERLAKDEGG